MWLQSITAYGFNLLADVRMLLIFKSKLRLFITAYSLSCNVYEFLDFNKARKKITPS
jgi:hypothetical protein